MKKVFSEKEICQICEFEKKCVLACPAYEKLIFLNRIVEVKKKGL
ncbi:MAG: hypothetical protein V1494_02885 [Candidatus Diapherotrites archaeon]